MYSSAVSSELEYKCYLERSVLDTVAENKSSESPVEVVTATTPRHDRDNKFDTETLALIREIGSALLMSPPHVYCSQQGYTQDEPSVDNMGGSVRFFVRKIEKQSILDQPKLASVKQCPDTLADTDCIRNTETDDIQLRPRVNSGNRNLSEVKREMLFHAVDPASYNPLCDSDIRINSDRKNSQEYTQFSEHEEQSDIDSTANGIRVTRTRSFGSVSDLVGKFEIKSPIRPDSDFGRDYSKRFSDSPETRFPQRRTPDSPCDIWKSDGVLLSSVSQFHPHGSGVSTPSRDSPPFHVTNQSKPAMFCSDSVHQSQQSSCLPRNSTDLDDLDPENKHKLNSSKDSVNITRHAVPSPFIGSLSSHEGRRWRSVRPHSLVDSRRTSIPEGKLYTDCMSGDICRDKSSGSQYYTSTGSADFRQSSEEGRKIRRLHGKSHPLTKLSQQRVGGGPFYSSM